MLRVVTCCFVARCLLRAACLLFIVYCVVVGCAALLLVGCCSMLMFCGALFVRCYCPVLAVGSR